MIGLIFFFFKEIHFEKTIVFILYKYLKMCE
jgi:hypothetical protein